jgi:UDP-2,3-diacylglucosamine pyrophosphatase LpxH
MRIAVISDTHFGDPLCTLVTNGHDGEPQLGPAYPALRNAVGKVDYLILLGDILDFSVASYERAYKQAQVFFRAVQRDIAQQIVYLPGNHDFDIWHTIEHQVNVINQLKQGELPRAFKWSVPAVIDDRRPSLEDKFLLPDVKAKPEWHENHASYGNLFLDHITRQRSPKTGRAVGKKLTFNFAYPNLYLVTESGECVLLTHGHYLEAYWAIAAEWALRLAHEDLGLEEPGELNMREMVGLNLPLNQLACSGIGQSEPLTDLIRIVQTEAHAGRTDSLRRYLDRLVSAIGRENGISRATRWARIRALRWLEKRFLSMVQRTERTRYSTEFFRRPEVRERFRKYYGYSMNEIERLQREYALDIPAPDYVVFGHTHQPIPWGSGELVDNVGGKDVRLCNTGGWLLKQGPGDSLDFVGAEVLLYESGRGLYSRSIRTPEVYPDLSALELHESPSRVG